jgi:hypothetical protein
MISPARIYAMEQANKLVKISLQEFFKHIQSQFYPDQDISFMDYFLELTQHEDEFVVPHSKLLEYGIMTSTRSSVILEKLTSLGLENDVHYRLQDVLQPVKQGGFTKSKHYTLTPEAFKLCLMRAQRRTDQGKDPVMYAMYYLLLEKVFKLYTDYEREYSKCLLAIKDGKIDSLTDKVDDLLDKNKKQSSEIHQLIIANKELLVNTRHIVVQNDNLSTDNTHMSAQISDLHSTVSQLNDKIDALFEFMLSFARMTIPTWIGSSVIKQQYDKLVKGPDDTKYALDHLKIMFYVGFYDQVDHPVKQTKVVDGKTITFTGRGNLKIYACCTNFSDIADRIRMLYKRHTNDKKHPMMYMLQPMAITLISCEINSERIILENSTQIFPERSIATWNSTYKSFDLIIGTSHYDRAQKIFTDICDNATGLRFQGYQQRIDKFDQATNVDVDPKIIDYIDEVDHEFYNSTRPFCQSFLNSYSKQVLDKDTQELIEYAYTISSRKCIIRADLNNDNLTNNTYCLRKIERLMLEQTNRDHIQYMTDNGLLTKEDLPALRAIAKYENIDVSTLIEEYDSDLEE